jgi:hypothetical protein
MRLGRFKSPEPVGQLGRISADRISHGGRKTAGKERANGTPE